MNNTDNNNGLYSPSFEHDSCGIGFIANLKGLKTHRLIDDALTMLENMEHRGGTGYDKDTGDGAGILIQIPHEFFVRECRHLGFKLPQYGSYGVGMVFFPKEKGKREQCKKILNEAITDSGLELLGYRKVPVNPDGIGKLALNSAPEIEQVFIRLKDNIYAPDMLERKIFVLRKYTTLVVRKKFPQSQDDFYLSSMSYKTIVYKGLFTTYQLRSYYPDLTNYRLKSAIGIIHSRFSTNTFPNWKLAQPFDIIAHNGEINTIKGNINWMKAKEVLMESILFSDEELKMMMPICDPSRSDSSNLDSMIEMLVFGGRSLPHAMMMLIPEAWQEDNNMSADKKGFYQYHASLMEPWDGPASICFTDGKFVGATLDRNGLRPSRYVVTKDDMVIMSSEAGALPVDPARVLAKGRVRPGRMFIADIQQGRIISDKVLKKEISLQQPYGEWVKENLVDIKELPAPKMKRKYDTSFLREKQIALGLTSEDIRLIIKPMVEKPIEPIGSMGSDTPLAVLSNQSRHLSNYFKQQFAQVSNPPIDPIRERLVMSLYGRLGPKRNLLKETPEHCKQIHIEHPVLNKKQFEALVAIKSGYFKSAVLDAYFSPDYKKGDLLTQLKQICRTAAKQIKKGASIIIIRNATPGKNKVPIPSLLITAHLQHYLLRQKLRAKASIVVKGGDVWETHHFATLIGYGAAAIYPVTTYAGISELYEQGQLDNAKTIKHYHENYRQAICYGLLKVMSKMGISTIQSYRNAQIFEALGINKRVIDNSFTNTVSRIGGIGYDDIATEQLIRHKVAFPEVYLSDTLPVGGIYQWKRQGEHHLFNPESVHLLQQATWKNDFNTYKKFADSINNQTEQAITLRGLFQFKPTKSIPIDEVEPAENIFKRFATGAMSFGSISHEAHTTLAIAMNRIGAKSNSGEGGEDEIRYERKPNGDWEQSAIKQVASGRFGVTSNYLTHAAELQIKMAQGAKPGEGGQLPGHKVDDWIGRVRHSTPGVGLISPPPHHDIYSIEDLAQLIFDLKNANRAARINVKLVSEAGVGTIAAGVAKAKADVILISGHDGGTGASPLSSIQHAGLPWELGVAEAHQTLLMNRLRDRVTLQADGQLRTGKDLAIATILGAEEWGISTAALVVEGCIMMRKCHENTCPVGIATQRKDLRELYTGKVEHVINYFKFLAEDLRLIMAQLGVKSVTELIGRTDFLKAEVDSSNWKQKNLKLEGILLQAPLQAGQKGYKSEPQKHAVDDVLDWQLLKQAKIYFGNQTPLRANFNIKNTDRSLGTLLSNEISKIYGSIGLPQESLHFIFKGSAGQSFGAFATKGLLLELEGEGNDYFGKGLSGATLVAYPDKRSTFDWENEIIIGNVALYGATSGCIFIRGLAGERFAVRNSGAEAIVEGVGDHACEYMTGGLVAILGTTGRNFGAGMSGGMAYVFDPKKQLEKNNKEKDLLFEGLLYEDRVKLNQMIKEHYELTGSNTAQKMLIYWKETITSFVKVIPRDYKIAIEKLREEDETTLIRKIV